MGWGCHFVDKTQKNMGVAAMTNPVDDMIAYVHGPDPESGYVPIETLRAMVAEIERLRTALRDIISPRSPKTANTMHAIARAALEPKKPT